MGLASSWCSAVVLGAGLPGQRSPRLRYGYASRLPQVMVLIFQRFLEAPSRNRSPACGPLQGVVREDFLEDLLEDRDQWLAFTRTLSPPLYALPLLARGSFSVFLRGKMRKERLLNHLTNFQLQLCRSVQMSYQSEDQSAPPWFLFHIFCLRSSGNQKAERREFRRSAASRGDSRSRTSH